MTDVIPSTKVTSATGGQAKPIGLPASITNPPPAVAGLAIGTILRGVVQGRDSHGHSLVETRLGTLLVNSPAKLSSGNQVALQIRAAGSELLITILQIDGHVAQAAGTRSPPPPAPVPLASPITPLASSAATAPPEVVLALGQTLRAVVQGPPDQSITSGPDRAGLPVQTPVPTAGLTAGSRLQVKVLEIVAPNGAPSGSSPAGPGKSAGPGHPTPNSIGYRADSSEGRVQFQSLVIGTAAKGLPVVRSPFGTFTVNLSGSLPVGTRLLLEVAAADLDQSGNRMARPVERPAALAYHWPALQETLDGLPHDAGTAAHALLGPRGVPQPGPRLSSEILFFLQALRGGRLDGWLGGQATKVLERLAGGDLASRLTREFTQLSRLSENTSGEWRFFPIPLYDGSELHQLRLFVRGRDPRNGGPAGPGDDEAATRFVVDLEHSRLGPLQLDGLVRERRFDLVLRSRKSLSEVLRRDITAIYDEAKSVSGYGGRIGFQASEDWRALRPEQEPRDAASLVV